VISFSLLYTAAGALFLSKQSRSGDDYSCSTSTAMLLPLATPVGMFIRRTL
jgi:hypothetical protein